MRAVLPSGEMSPASAGIDIGSMAPAEPGASINAVAKDFTASGESAIGVSCTTTTIAASAPAWGKSRRSSSRTSTAVEPCASQPAPESALVRVRARGAAAIVSTAQNAIIALR